MLRVRGTEKGALLLTADRKRNRKSNIQISLSDTAKTAVSALPPGRKNVLPRRKRVPFFVSRGSLTVEAALAVPLFFFCVIALVCLMEMYGLYVRKLTVLQQRAESVHTVASRSLSTDRSLSELERRILASNEFLHCSTLYEWRRDLDGSQEHLVSGQICDVRSSVILGNGGSLDG